VVLVFSAVILCSSKQVSDTNLIRNRKWLSQSCILASPFSAPWRLRIDVALNWSLKTKSAIYPLDVLKWLNVPCRDRASSNGRQFRSQARYVTALPRCIDVSLEAIFPQWDSVQVSHSSCGLLSFLVAVGRHRASL
jgi:hypothetical protein